MSSPPQIASPLVSIIVPVYNAARLLPFALESAFAQTLPDFELIIVDDGSTDETPRLLESYRDRARILRQPNGGASRARNAGIRQAAGEFIAFLDADDIWDPRKLELQVERLRQDPEAGVCYTECDYFDEEKTWSAAIAARAPQGRMVFHDLLTERFIPMSSVMVRRSCLEDVGLFDESLVGCEDYNLYLRLARKYAYCFVPEPLVKLRCHEGNLSNNLPQMCRDEIANLKKINELFPEMQLPLRQLQGKILYRFGQYFFDGQDFAAARRAFRQAIRCNPGRLPAYVYLAAASLPPALRESMRAALRAVRGTGRQNAAA